MMVLPGPDGSYPLHLSLRLVAETETRHGSLYLIAENILNRTLTFSAIVEILKTFYRQAGCSVTEEQLEDFLLRQPCAELLTQILVCILDPLGRMGVTRAGEAPAVRTDAHP